MDARKVEIPYDESAELMMHRVTLFRFGVPSRVLDQYIPVEGA